MNKSAHSYINQIHASNNLIALQPFFQAAIELEHATLPPYLTAKFSLEHGKNEQIRDVLRNIMKEEMLHMTIAANILNAIGGIPRIYFEDFIPKYPGPLPFNMKDNLIVGLSKYSPEQVRDVFMVIEEPDDIIHVKGATSQNNKAIDNSIGEFYLALRNQIESMGTNKQLPGDSKRQVVSDFYPHSELFPIIYPDDAIRAIDIIIEQGEGSQVAPLNVEGEMAHYYKFLELFEQKTIIKEEDESYSLGAPDISFDASAVYNLYPNTKAFMLDEGSEELRALNKFNEIYGQILLTLQWAYNGQPEKMDQSIGLMFYLQLVGEKLCQTPFPGKPGMYIGPSYEFKPLSIRKV